MNGIFPSINGIDELKKTAQYYLVRIYCPIPYHSNLKQNLLNWHQGVDLVMNNQYFFKNVISLVVTIDCCNCLLHMNKDSEIP